MDLLTLVNAAATVTTITAAVLVASNFSPSIMVSGFATFVAASGLWMVSGYLDGTISLVIQNAVLLVINAVGIYRWLPRAASIIN